ncbi:cathepsin K-like isoform X3 [Denticeps clupeoides]|uniref:cathepsin K-like isoform X3 n=1 Tax=Denticeps clupeoides TaxID=299321 RepID=UPI0010A37F23|nr:cathepsin K-like isoform X3 [Denticeps clupeoides]
MHVHAVCPLSMNLLIITAASLVALTRAGGALQDLEFQKWKLMYGRSYNSPEEEARRKLTWLDNYRSILVHNVQADQGLRTYRLGLNQFADMNKQEYRKTHRLLTNSTKVHHGTEFTRRKWRGELPDAVDWRKTGCVSAVQDQGGCNSALAFGFPGDCRFNPKTIGGTCSGYALMTPGNEDALQEAVALVGPVIAFIDASHPSFQFYQSGVYYEPNCSSTEVDHVVLVVGYGQEDGQDYWLVKNSWGTFWGEKGYMKMARNRSNMCGIASDAGCPKA